MFVKTSPHIIVFFNLYALPKILTWTRVTLVGVPMFYSIHITMTSHELHVVSNDRSFDCLLTANPDHMKVRITGPFVWEIHRWPEQENTDRCSIWCNNDFHVDLYTAWTLQWRHNGRDGISNNQRLACLLNRLFRHSSKKTSKLRVTDLYEGNLPMNSPHKRPLTRKMSPFDDVIMKMATRWRHDIYKLYYWMKKWYFI